MTNRNAWQCTAAYLYILQLDGPGLAWEYLRRNPRYRDDWARAVRGTGDVRHWGLAFPEHPDLDARQARPVWIAPQARWVRLVRDDDPQAERFDLWAIPGRKSLEPDGEGLRVYVEVDGQLAGLVLPETLGDGDRCMCERPDGTRVPPSVALDFLFQPRSKPSVETQEPASRPPPGSMFHAQALQALDGVHAGASEEEIAVVLFGEAAAGKGRRFDGTLDPQGRGLH